MNTQTEQNINDDDLLAAEIAAKVQEKQELKSTALKTLHEIEVDGIKMTTHLTLAQVLQIQKEMVSIDLNTQIQQQALLDSARAKMNFAYQNKGVEIELTHEEAKLLDPFYPFDENGNEIDFEV